MNDLFVFILFFRCFFQNSAQPFRALADRLGELKLSRDKLEEPLEPLFEKGKLHIFVAAPQKEVYLNTMAIGQPQGGTLGLKSHVVVAGADFDLNDFDEGVLAPLGRDPVLWRFTGGHTHRVTVAVRLQRDLGINLAGVALALQLLDEVESLRARLREFESE